MTSRDTTFRVRPAVFADLERIVDITIGATADLALTKFNFPNRAKFPEDNRYGWKVLLRSMFYDPNSVVLVAETLSAREILYTRDANLESRVEHDKPIVAWAEWEWKPKQPNEKPPHVLFGNSWTKTFLRNWYGIINAAVDLYWTREDVNQKHRHVWLASKAQISREYWEQRPHLFYLSGLYTDPMHQGQGAGTLLKDWGVDVAKRNKLDIGLIATHPPSVEIYQHWGFKIIGTLRMQGDEEYEFVDLQVLHLA